jgi:hypothetical protein
MVEKYETTEQTKQQLTQTIMRMKQKELLETKDEVTIHTLK